MILSSLILWVKKSFSLFMAGVTMAGLLTAMMIGPKRVYPVENPVTDVLNCAFG